jgi:hypothetical protein
VVHKTVFRNSVQRERLEELTFVGPDAAIVEVLQHVDWRRTVPPTRPFVAARS